MIAAGCVQVVDPPSIRERLVDRAFAQAPRGEAQRRAHPRPRRRASPQRDETPVQRCATVPYSYSETEITPLPSSAEPAREPNADGGVSSDSGEPCHRRTRRPRRQLRRASRGSTPLDQVQAISAAARYAAPSPPRRRRIQSRRSGSCASGALRATARRPRAARRVRVRPARYAAMASLDVVPGQAHSGEPSKGPAGFSRPNGRQMPPRGGMRQEKAVTYALPSASS